MPAVCVVTCAVASKHMAYGLRLAVALDCLASWLYTKVEVYLYFLCSAMNYIQPLASTMTWCDSTVKSMLEQIGRPTLETSMLCQARLGTY